MKVALYSRVSTKDQDNTNQLKDLFRYCKAQDYKDIYVYLDKVSGTKSDRENFIKLFQDASKRKFDLLIVWSLDRFSREGAGATIKYLNELESYGIKFKSYSEQYIDTSGVFKEAIISILATLAKQEQIRLSERVKAGLNRVKASGKKLGRPKISNDVKQDIINFKKFGYSNREIGRLTNVDSKTVSKYLE